jgi:hypothetical protein
MRRLKLAILAATLVVAIARPVSATPVDVLVSGQTKMVIIDADGNGPDAGDCEFKATFDDPTLLIIKLQALPPFFRICSGNTSGSSFVGQDSSSDFLYTNLTLSTTPASGASSSPLGFGLGAPVAIDAYEEFFAGSPDGLPININTIEFENPPGEEFVTLSLCEAGGPAALAKLDGTSLLLPLSFSPNAANPDYLVIPNLPLEKAAPDLGTFAFPDVYIPMTGNAITMALADDPNDLILDVRFDNLLPCGLNAAAPTLTNLGAVVVALGLLALGCRRLGRRKRFAESLPLP